MNIRQQSPSVREPGLAGGRWLQLMLTIALGVSGYLLWVSLQGGGAIGCGPASGCDAVLKSRWAYVAGIPVSAPAMLFYVYGIILLHWMITATSPERLRSLWPKGLFLASVLIGVAAWFVALQVLVIHKVCPFCMVAHGGGLMVGLWLWLKRPSTGIPSITWQREKFVYLPPGTVNKVLGTAGLVLGLFFATQLMFEKRSYAIKTLPAIATTSQKTSPPPLPSAKLSTNLALAPQKPLIPVTVSNSPTPIPSAAVSSDIVTFQDTPEGRMAVLYGGKFQYNVKELPFLGAVTATNQVLYLFDYTCQHCRLVHRHLNEALVKFGNRFSILCLPVPLDKTCNSLIPRQLPEHVNACQYAKLSLAIWRAEPARFQEFDAWLFQTNGLPAPAAAHQQATQLIGAEVLARTLNDPWIQNMLNQNFSLHYTNYLKLGDDLLPQVMFPRKVTFGEFNRAEDLYKMVEENLPRQ
jgi:uncharacterized membrane protein/protein-disulfide isomerase